MKKLEVENLVSDSLYRVVNSDRGLAILFCAQEEFLTVSTGASTGYITITLYFGGEGTGVFDFVMLLAL